MNGERAQPEGLLDSSRWSQHCSDHRRVRELLITRHGVQEISGASRRDANELLHAFRWSTLRCDAPATFARTLRVGKLKFVGQLAIRYSFSPSSLKLRERRNLFEELIMEPLTTLLALFFFGFMAIVLLVIAAKTIRIVPQATVMLVERLGRFSFVANSGLNLLWPFLDRPRAVYWQITDPVKAVYEMNDLVGGIVQLTITGMRAVMGDMDLDHTLSQRDQINAKLRIILDEATDKWGVKVTRVDVKNINPPEDVRITMEKQMTAERNRRALVLQAEGDRQAAITRAEGEKQAAVTRAEGEKQSAILQAEGAAQSRLRNAEAEAEAIARVSQAMLNHGNPAQYLITTRYIESLRDMTRTNNAKVIFMPVETSAMLSSVGAIKEVLAQTGEKSGENSPPPPPKPRQLPT